MLQPEPQTLTPRLLLLLVCALRIRSYNTKARLQHPREGTSYKVYKIKNKKMNLKISVLNLAASIAVAVGRHHNVGLVLAESASVYLKGVSASAFGGSDRSDGNGVAVRLYFSLVYHQ